MVVILLVVMVAFITFTVIVSLVGRVFVAARLFFDDEHIVLDFDAVGVTSDDVGKLSAVSQLNLALGQAVLVPQTVTVTQAHEGVLNQRVKQRTDERLTLTLLNKTEYPEIDIGSGIVQVSELGLKIGIRSDVGKIGYRRHVAGSEKIINLRQAVISTALNVQSGQIETTLSGFAEQEVTDVVYNLVVEFFSDSAGELCEDVAQIVHTVREVVRREEQIAKFVFFCQLGRKHRVTESVGSSGEFVCELRVSSAIVRVARQITTEKQWQELVERNSFDFGFDHQLSSLVDFFVTEVRTGFSDFAGPVIVLANE